MGTIPMTTMIPEKELPATRDASEGLDFKMDLHASSRALRRVRVDDNPWQSIDVGRFRLYVAGMMTVLEDLRDRPLVVENPNVKDVPAKHFNYMQSERARCAAKAISRLEDALLYAERAMTVR